MQIVEMFTRNNTNESIGGGVSKEGFLSLAEKL